LDERPDHPVLCQSGPIALLQLVFRTCSFHDGHAAQEDEQVGAGKERLVASNPGSNFKVLVWEDDLVLQKLEPGGCSWTEDSCEKLFVSGEVFKLERANPPPPYNAMRPERARSWFRKPFFSTNCCAMVSPVANSTAVVMLWVSNGREASFI
jgi:hypothetical protein